MLLTLIARVMCSVSAPVAVSPQTLWRNSTGPVVVGIRPEDIKLAASSTGGENRLEGKVLSSAFLGDQVIAEVKINETTLTVKAMPDDQKRVGKISVHFPKERIVVFPASAPVREAALQ